MSNNPLMAAFAGEPTLVEPAMVERFKSCLIQAAAHPRFGELAFVGTADADDYWSDDYSWVRPYVIKDGVLQIPVKGVLLNNFPYALGSWATGYEYIWRAFQRGCGDYSTGVIKGIALVEDTPGGMVAGCFDAVDKMVALKEQVGVPVRAFAHESAYSAGYAIATVADKIAVSRTGGVGSIGVVTTHVDLSGALEKQGAKITFICSDPSKVEGNYTEAPTQDFLDRTQARIDELYEIFVSAVARSRGISADTIRSDLKAYCYTATQATSNGLADYVGSLDDAVAAFCADLEANPEEDGEDDMTTQNTGGVDQAAHDLAVANARTEGERAGAVAATARISTILGSEEATDRRGLAEHFAFKTDMGADAAVEALKVSPKTPAAAAAQTPADAATFHAAMDSNGTPAVGSGDGANADFASELSPQEQADYALLVRAGYMKAK